MKKFLAILFAALITSEAAFSVNIPLVQSDVYPDEMKAHGFKKLDDFYRWKVDGLEKDECGAWEFKVSMNDYSQILKKRSKLFAIVDYKVYTMSGKDYCAKLWIVEKGNEEYYQKAKKAYDLLEKACTYTPKIGHLVDCMKQYYSYLQNPDEYHRNAMVEMIVADGSDALPKPWEEFQYGSLDNKLYSDSQVEGFLNLFPPSVTNDPRVKNRLFELAKSRVDQYNTPAYYDLRDYIMRYHDYSDIEDEKSLDDLEELLFNRIVSPREVDYYIQALPQGKRIDLVKYYYSDGTYEGLYKYQAGILPTIMEDLKSYISARLSGYEDTRYSYLKGYPIAEVMGDKSTMDMALYRTHHNRYEREKMEAINRNLLMAALTANRVKELCTTQKDYDNAKAVLALVDLADGFWAVDNQNRKFALTRQQNYHESLIMNTYQRACNSASNKNIKKDPSIKNAKEYFNNRYLGYLDKLVEISTREKESARASAKQAHADHGVKSYNFEQQGDRQLLWVYMNNYDIYVLYFNTRDKEWRSQSGNGFVYGSTLDEVLRNCSKVNKEYWDNY